MIFPHDCSGMHVPALCSHLLILTEVGEWWARGSLTVHQGELRIGVGH